MRGKLFSGIVQSSRFLTGHEGFSIAPIKCFSQVFKWYLNVVLGRPPQLSIKEWNASFLLPCIFRSPAKVFYVFGRNYEPEIRFLESYLEAGDVFVDGGANFGLYTVLASHFVGAKGKVLAFEPFPSSFEATKKNIELNRIKNAELFQVALSDQTGEAQLGIHDDPGRNSLSLDPAETVTTISIKRITADELWAAKDLPLPTVIKLDVEGHECSILMGARRILAQSNPTIIFELNPPACQRAGHQASAVPELLHQLGYNFYSFSEGGLVPAIPESGDFVAIHSARMQEHRNRTLQGREK